MQEVREVVVIEDPTKVLHLAAVYCRSKIAGVAVTSAGDGPPMYEAAMQPNAATETYSRSQPAGGFGMATQRSPKRRALLFAPCCQAHNGSMDYQPTLSQYSTKDLGILTTARSDSRSEQSV